jgi:hypothetical protein
VHKKGQLINLHAFEHLIELLGYLDGIERCRLRTDIGVSAKLAVREKCCLTWTNVAMIRGIGARKRSSGRASVPPYQASIGPLEV